MTHVATATELEQITRTALDREYLHLVRTADGWKIANALWRFT